MLVDEHAQMAAALQHALHREGGALAGRLEASHGLAADLVHGPRNGGIVGRPEHRRGVETVAGGADRRQFPVAEMGGEDQSGPAVVLQGDEIVDALDLDAALGLGLA